MWLTVHDQRNKTKQKNFSLIGEAVVFFIPNPLHLCFFLSIQFRAAQSVLALYVSSPISFFFSFPSLFPRFFIKTAVSYSGLRLKLEARQHCRKREKELRERRLKKNGWGRKERSGWEAEKPLGAIRLVRFLNKQTGGQNEASPRIPPSHLPRAKSHLSGIRLKTGGWRDRDRTRAADSSRH